jgi:hypothetical protein
MDGPETLYRFNQARRIVKAASSILFHAISQMSGFSGRAPKKIKEKKNDAVHNSNT